MFFVVPGPNMEQIENEHQKMFGKIKKTGGPELVKKEPEEFSFPQPSLVLVQSGGTEKAIIEALERLSAPFYLIAGDKFNALPAAMEVLTYLRRKGKDAEIIHGPPELMARRLKEIREAKRTIKGLSGLRLGMVGDPSDWLVASSVNQDNLEKFWGIDFVKVEMDELEEFIDRVEPAETNLDLNCFPPEVARGSLKILAALEELIRKYDLQGLTLRCFDLLGSKNNTGCLGISLLNDRGIIAGCEGDVPALISMAIIQILTGKPSFMANPAQIDPENNELILAHCTVPLNLTEGHTLHSHFESGLGVALRGKIPPGPCTVFKIGADGRDYFVSRGEIIENLEREDLCRTQLKIKLEKPVSYFLSNPLGNHHIIVPGDYSEQIKEAFRIAGLK